MARKPKGRGNGEGSVHKDKHGQWWAQLTIDVDHGKFARARATSQKDGIVKLAALQAKHRTGIRMGERLPTLEAWCDAWIKDHAGHLRPHIRDDYADVFTHYVKGSKLGKTLLDRVTLEIVQTWLNGLKRVTTNAEAAPLPLAPRTIRNVHARLRSALARAVKLKLITINPAIDVILPKEEYFEVTPLNEQQIVQFLEVANAHRLYALWHLAIYTGMREAEIIALRWIDVNLNNHTLRVSGQLQRTREGVKRLEPKTTSGRRTITLGPVLSKMLAEHKEGQAEKFPNAEYVFGSRHGTPLDNSNLLKQFKRLLERAKLPELRFHDLRHTAASQMLMAGYTDGEVASILGHRDSSLIRKLYGHVYPERTATAVDTLAQRFATKKKRTG